MSDLLMVADAGDVSVQALQDISAAFNTVNHSILLQQLTVSHNVRGLALAWFESYLQERVQSVQYDRIIASPTSAMNSVPQGSVLGPLFPCSTPRHTEYCKSSRSSLSVLCR